MAENEENKKGEPKNRETDSKKLEDFREDLDSEHNKELILEEEEDRLKNKLLGEEELESKKRSSIEQLGKKKRELEEIEKELSTLEDKLKAEELEHKVRELSDDEDLIERWEKTLKDKQDELDTVKSYFEKEKEGGVYAKIKESLSESPNESITMIIYKPSHYMEAVSSVLVSTIKEKNECGVYISVSRPYNSILEVINREKIPVHNVVFIDCVTRMMGRQTTAEANVVFVENPSTLEEIGMYSDKLLARMSEPRFIIFDSLSSILIYNNMKSTTEFSHFLINKMRGERVRGIIMTADDPQVGELTRVLEPMCDNIIRME